MILNEYFPIISKNYSSQFQPLEYQDHISQHLPVLQDLSSPRGSSHSAFSEIEC